MLAEGLNKLLNMLSIREPLSVENRVGNVICVFRLCDVRRSRNSPYSKFSFTICYNTHSNSVGIMHNQKVELP